MNIVTPIITALAYPTANVNTESARRDNVLRETIPQTSDAEQGASQKGLGSESDKTRNPGQQPAPVTYERPQMQTELQGAFENVFGQDKDNAEQESAGKQNAKDEQQAQQQTPEEQEEIESLAERDKEVRTHEQAHAAAGGQYAGAPQYQYTTGPDNKSYVTDGEVSIDISEAQTPEQTVTKMQQVRAAALAPAQPSSQDLKVAAEAAQKAFEARKEIAQEKAQDAQPVASAPSLDELTEASTVEPPTRSLDSALLSAQQATQENSQSGMPDSGARTLNFASSQGSEDVMQARGGRIQQFYAQSYTPSREGFSASV